MDSFRFDTLARLLGRPASRRRGLGLLAGTFLAGSLSRFDVAADETLKPNGKKCNKDKQCISGSCCGVGHARQGVCQDPTAQYEISPDACSAQDPCDPATCGAAGGKVSVGNSPQCCNQSENNCIKLRGGGGIQAFCVPQN